MRIRLDILTATMLLLVGGASVASANTITVGDGALQLGPYYLLQSYPNSLPADSYVKVGLSAPLPFDSITSLSSDFLDLGGAYGGSPRIVLGATNGDFFSVYLGTPPDFNDMDISSFSGANLNNGTNDAAFENSGTYQTLGSLQGSSLYSGDTIDYVKFVLDGGWAEPQELLLGDINVNGVNVAANVPEPSSIAVLLAGLGLIGGAMYFGRKKLAAAKA